MKHSNLFIIPAILLAFTGCQDEPKPQPPAHVEPRVEAVDPAIPAVVIVAPAAPIATPAPVVQLAPDGVFVLRYAVSIETDSGVTGFPASTRVDRVRPGVYKAGSTELKLEPEQITNVLSEIRQLMAAQQAAQLAAQTTRPVAPVATPLPATPAPQQAPRSAAQRQVVAPLDQPARKVNSGNISEYDKYGKRRSY